MTDLAKYDAARLNAAANAVMGVLGPHGIQAALSTRYDVAAAVLDAVGPLDATEWMAVERDLKAIVPHSDPMATYWYKERIEEVALKLIARREHGTPYVSREDGIRTEIAQVRERTARQHETGLDLPTPPVAWGESCTHDWQPMLSHDGAGITDTLASSECSRCGDRIDYIHRLGNRERL